MDHNPGADRETKNGAPRNVQECPGMSGNAGNAIPGMICRNAGNVIPGMSGNAGNAIPGMTGNAGNMLP